MSPGLTLSILPNLTVSIPGLINGNMLTPLHGMMTSFPSESLCRTSAKRISLLITNRSILLQRYGIFVIFAMCQNKTQLPNVSKHFRFRHSISARCRAEKSHAHQKRIEHQYDKRFNPFLSISLYRQEQHPTDFRNTTRYGLRANPGQGIVRQETTKETECNRR